MSEYENKSLIDVAYEVLSKQNSPIPFSEFYDEVAKRCWFTDEEKDEKISKFFTSLSLDGRFVALKNNEWDLRSRQTFDKVHVDLNAIYEDIEQEDKTGSSFDFENDNDDTILRGDDDEEEEERSNFDDSQEEF